MTRTPPPIICENPDCRYAFYRIESVLCCPACGEIQEKAMAQVSPTLRPEMYAKILAFQDYFQRNKLIDTLLEISSALLTVVEIMADGLFGSSYGTRASRYFWRNVWWGRRFLIMVLLFYFAKPYNNYLILWLFRHHPQALYTTRGQAGFCIAYGLMLCLLLYFQVPSYTSWLIRTVWQEGRPTQIIYNNLWYYAMELTLATCYMYFSQWFLWDAKRRCQDLRIPRP